jgi:serine protease Do
MVFGKLYKSKEPKISSFSTRSSRSGESPTLRLPTDLLKRGFLVGAVSLLFGFGGGWLGARVYNHGQSAVPTAGVRQQIISSESQLISEIAKNVGPGVVSIEVKRQVSTPDIFGFGSSISTQRAAGTGFIISGSGIIITNRHVVPAGVSSVSVTLADGTHFDNVKVIGRTATASNLDVAFLKITDLKGKKLSPLMLGDSSKVKVGDRVVAIGNALGQFQNTVTSGIISGYGRDVTAGDDTGQSTETLTDLFQTDAAINSGNSGGPLVNFSGEVIGINTAVAGGAENIGFAIPINDVKGLIASVLKHGKLEQPFLGVRYVSLTDDLAAEFGLDVKRGAYIVPSQDGQESIIAGSPAEKAGLKEGDIITKVNNIEINEKNNLSSVLSRFQVGDTVTLKVLRDSKTFTLRVTLQAAPSN